MAGAPKDRAKRVWRLGEDCTGVSSSGATHRTAQKRGTRGQKVKCPGPRRKEVMEKEVGGGVGRGRLHHKCIVWRNLTLKERSEAQRNKTQGDFPPSLGHVLDRGH